MAQQSRLTDEEFRALDDAAWNALGGRCACAPDAPPCKRDMEQMDVLAWVLGSLLADGTPMLDRWLREREFPALFRATWGESLE